MIEDILVNISPIIFLINIFVIIIALAKDKLLIFILASFFYVICFLTMIKLIFDGYGHIFLIIISLALNTILSILSISYFIDDFESKITKILFAILNVVTTIYFWLVIFDDLSEGRIIEWIGNVAGLDCKKFFESIIENDWFKGISIGIIGTVCGGIILDKIKNRK